jgi:transposase
VICLSYCPRCCISFGNRTDADKVCECGCALTHIGEDTSEQLDIIPAKIQVLQHARLKYACKACESTVRTATLFTQPILRSNTSAGLLAYIAKAKYQDALPVHRQENIFKRMEIDIPRITLANWMMRSGELIAQFDRNSAEAKSSSVTKRR